MSDTAFVITTVSLETNGNHVLRSLILELSCAAGETASRCVCYEMIQYDNHAIRGGYRERLTPGQCLLSKLIAHSQRIVEESHCIIELYLPLTL